MKKLFKIENFNPNKSYGNLAEVKKINKIITNQSTVGKAIISVALKRFAKLLKMYGQPEMIVTSQDPDGEAKFQSFLKKYMQEYDDWGDPIKIYWSLHFSAMHVAGQTYNIAVIDRSNNIKHTY